MSNPPSCKNGCGNPAASDGLCWDCPKFKTTSPSSPPAIDIAAELRDLREHSEDAGNMLSYNDTQRAGMRRLADEAEENLRAEYTRQAAEIERLRQQVAELEHDGVYWAATSVLMRVFDDGDEALAEWEAFDKSGWFTPERALGAFIRIRLYRRAQEAASHEG